METIPSIKKRETETKTRERFIYDYELIHAFYLRFLCRRTIYHVVERYARGKFYFWIISFLCFYRITGRLLSRTHIHAHKLVVIQYRRHIWQKAH